MEDISKVILTFKDQRYSLLKAKSKADTGPIATLAVAELDVSEKALALFKLPEDCPQFHGGSISFFKYEGKFIVFGGRDQVLRDIAKGKTHIAGHVLSSPALKAARIDTPVAAAPVQLEALTQRFNSAPPKRVEVRAPRKPYGDRPAAARNASGTTLHTRSK